MLFFKGLIVGIGKILPGVSGSLMAISMNIYAPLLESINNFSKKNIKFLFPVLSGILTAIVLLSKILSHAINNYYFTILLLFIGLIMGSVDLKSINLKTKKISKFITFTISFTLIILIEKITVNINLPDNYVTNILLGIIEAISTIIPGISGTALYMALGKYEKIIEAFANPFENIVFFIPFIIGLTIGVLVISKLITNLLKKHEEIFYCSSLGFTIATLIIMYLKTININKNFISIIIGEALLVVGFIISKKLNKL